jgi:hypothetical protein
MALYNVLYTNRAEMSIINEVPFTELDKAIAFADSQVEGMEKCTGDPETDSHPSCCYTVTTAPEKDVISTNGNPKTYIRQIGIGSRWNNTSSHLISPTRVSAYRLRVHHQARSL